MSHALSCPARMFFARWRTAVALLACLCISPSFAAGLTTTIVAAADSRGAIEVLVWTPCDSPAARMQMGPYVVDATAGCPVAGRALPLVVISHGQGGTRLGHHDTATALANSGFVVASFNHAGDSYGDDASTERLEIFESRPAEVSRVISHMLTQWQHREQIDSQAVGVFGFSRGGYTALAVAGALPSATASASRFCGPWWSFVRAMCRQFDPSRGLSTASLDSRVKAVVVVDPLNLFDRPGVDAVRVPVQLWASERGGAGIRLADVQSIRDSLPSGTEFFVARGAGHFAFLAPCTDEFRKEARAICEDPQGFDRQQWHATMNRAVSDFFIRTLGSSQGRVRSAVQPRSSAG